MVTPRLDLTHRAIVLQTFVSFVPFMLKSEAQIQLAPQSQQISRNALARIIHSRGFASVFLIANRFGVSVARGSPSPWSIE